MNYLGAGVFHYLDAPPDDFLHIHMQKETKELNVQLVAIKLPNVGCMSESCSWWILFLDFNTKKKMHCENDIIFFFQ